MGDHVESTEIAREHAGDQAMAVMTEYR